MLLQPSNKTRDNYSNRDIISTLQTRHFPQQMHKMNEPHLCSEIIIGKHYYCHRTIHTQRRRDQSDDKSKVTFLNPDARKACFLLSTGKKKRKRRKDNGFSHRTVLVVFFNTLNPFVGGDLDQVCSNCIQIHVAPSHADTQWFINLASLLIPCGESKKVHQGKKMVVSL